MAKITLPTITSLTNEESAVAALLAWKEELEDFSDLVLSRNGAEPNTMSATLDMNSNRIINIPAPVDDNDLVRLVDVAEGIRGPKGDQGPSGSVTDGDKGDIVVSGAGTVWTLDTAISSVINGHTTSLANLRGASLLDVGTTAGTVAAGDDGRFNRHTVVTKDATGNLAANEYFVRHTSASTHTYTIQPVGTVAYPLGVQIVIRNAPGAGAITLSRGAGVALYINGSTTSANGTISAGAVVTLVQDATNTWFAVGPGIA